MHPIWNIILFYLSILFISLTFFDSNFNTVKLENKNILLWAEIWFLTIFFIDSLFGIIQIISLYIYYKKKNSSKKIWKLNKYNYNADYFKIAIINILIIESIFYYNYNYYRIILILKVFLLPLYNKNLKEFIITLIMTYKQILEFIFYLWIFNIIYAAIGVRLYDSIAEKPADKNICNIESKGFFDLFIQLNILITFDNWSRIIYCVNEIALIFYYIPYIILNIWCFMPIPVAMLYESFKTNREKLEKVKKIYIKSCLNCCYDTLIDNNQLSKELFLELFEGIYKGKKKFNKQKVVSLYLEINGLIDKNMSKNKFWKIKNKLKYSLTLKKTNSQKYKYFKKLKKFMNKNLYLKIIITSNYFEVFIIFIVIVNSVSSILLFFEDLKVYNDPINLIDKVCTYIYLVEFILKILSLGLIKYYKDSWNIFDFIVLVISLTNNIIIANVINFNTAKLFKLTRIQKIIRISKGFKNLKFLKILDFILSFFKRMKVLLYYFIVCLPQIINSFSLIFMIFFVYAIIGFFWYNNIIIDNKLIFGNYTNLINSFFLLFQIMLGKNWSLIMDLFIRKYSYTIITYSYFFSFYFLIRIIILSLLLGLIWETFGVQEKGMKDFLSRTIFKNINYHQILFKKSGIEIKESNNIYENIVNYEEAYFNYLTLNKICVINSDIESNADADSFQTDDSIDSVKIPKDYKIKLFFDIEEEFKNNDFKSNSNSFSNSFDKEINNSLRFKNIIKNQNLNFENYKCSNINNFYLNDDIKKFLKLKNYKNKNDNSNKSQFNLETITDKSANEEVSKENSINEFSIYKNEIMSVILFLRKRINIFNIAIEKYKENIDHKILAKLFPSILLEIKYNRYSNYKYILKNNLNKNNTKNINNKCEEINNQKNIRELLNNLKKTSYIKQLGIDKKNNGIIMRTEVKFNESEILDFSNSYKENKKDKYFYKNLGPVFNKYINKYNPISTKNFNLQSQIINLFNYILINDSVQPNIFINALINLENILNFKLLKSKSIAKFVFNNNKSINFMFYNIKKYLDLIQLKNYNFVLQRFNKNFIIDIISNCFIENEINFGFDIFNNENMKNNFHDILDNMLLNSNKEIFNIDLKESIWTLMGFKLINNDKNKMKLLEKSVEIKNINWFIFDNVHAISRKENIKDIIKEKKKSTNIIDSKSQLKSLYELNLFLKDIVNLFNTHKDRVFSLLTEFFYKNRIS